MFGAFFLFVIFLKKLFLVWHVFGIFGSLGEMERKELADDGSFEYLFKGMFWKKIERKIGDRYIF